MHDWFRELNTYLTVAVDYEHHASRPDLNQTVTVRFTVTNSASPPQPGGATEIRFDDVSLNVGISPEMQRIDIGTLGPQESSVATLEAELADLSEIKYDVSGDISTEAFFRITPIESAPLPGEPANLPPRAYLRIFEDINVHRWLNSTIKEFPLPGPDTTLSQLTALAASLDETIADIRHTGDRLQRFSGFVSRENREAREAVSQHRNHVDVYLRETVQGIASLKQAISSSDVRQIESAVEHESERLEQSAGQMDRATEELGEQIGSL